MSLTLPAVAGKITPDAPLAPLVWFKSGGHAQWLFEPKDVADLCSFLEGLDPTVPVMALGLGAVKRCTFFSRRTGVSLCQPSSCTIWPSGQTSASSP